MELHHSSEQEAPKKVTKLFLNKPLVSEHFAYRIEDSLFWKSQSEAFKAAVKNLRHYRFVTGWTCLDVISEQEPNISVTKRART